MPMKEMIFNGNEDDLKRTKYSQPAILLTSLASAKAVELRGISAKYTLGLSLGEYGALVDSGVISFEDGIKLIKKRAEIMYNFFIIPNLILYFLMNQYHTRYIFLLIYLFFLQIHLMLFLDQLL